jgi:hypothetical protein
MAIEIDFVMLCDFKAGCEVFDSKNHNHEKETNKIDKLRRSIK